MSVRYPEAPVGVPPPERRPFPRQKVGVPPWVWAPSKVIRIYLSNQAATGRLWYLRWQVSQALLERRVAVLRVIALHHAFVHDHT